MRAIPNVCISPALAFAPLGRKEADSIWRSLGGVVLGIVQCKPLRRFFYNCTLWRPFICSFRSANAQYRRGRRFYLLRRFFWRRSFSQEPLSSCVRLFLFVRHFGPVRIRGLSPTGPARDSPFPAAPVPESFATASERQSRPRTCLPL